MSTFGSKEFAMSLVRPHGRLLDDLNESCELWLCFDDDCYRCYFEDNRRPRKRKLVKIKLSSEVWQCCGKGNEAMGHLYSTPMDGMRLVLEHELARVVAECSGSDLD